MDDLDDLDVVVLETDSIALSVVLLLRSAIRGDLRDMIMINKRF